MRALPSCLWVVLIGDDFRQVVHLRRVPGFPHRRDCQWQMHDGGFVNGLEPTGFPGKVYSLFIPQYGREVGIGNVTLQPSRSGETVALPFQAPAVLWLPCPRAWLAAVLDNNPLAIGCNTNSG